MVPTPVTYTMSPWQSQSHLGRVGMTLFRGTTRRSIVGVGASGIGVLGALALAACGGASGSGGAEAKPASKSPATLRLGERAGQEEQAFDARIPPFVQQFSHIKVERESISGDMIVALRAMAAADTLPDNLHSYTGGQQYHGFALGGSLLMVDALIARDKLDLKGWFPEMIDIMKIDGKLYGLPFKGQLLSAGFFYNASLFEKRGVPLPNDNWTMDDVVKAATQLTVRQGNDITQWGYAIQGMAGENFTPAMRQYGGDTFSKDGKKAAIDTAAVLEGMQWYENLLQRERIMHPAATTAPVTADQDMIDGKIAMIGRTYFNYKTNTMLTKVGDKYKWDSVMMPKHPKTGKRGGMFAGDAHSVWKNTKAPDAAFEFLKWVTNKEFGVALGLQTKGSTTLGGRPDVYGDERILNHPQLPKQTQQVQLKSVNEIKEPFSAAFNYRNPDIERVRDAGINKILGGEMKADAGSMKALNSELQNILDMPRP